MLGSLQALLQVFISSDWTVKKPPENIDTLSSQSVGHLKIINLTKLPPKQH